MTPSPTFHYTFSLMNQVVNIYSSEDYRDYLGGVYSTSKQNRSSFTLSMFARQLKLSPAVISQVLAKKRHLSEVQAWGVCGVLGLDGSRLSYFFESLRYQIAVKRDLDPDYQYFLKKRLERLSDEEDQKFELIDASKADETSPRAESSLYFDWQMQVILEATYLSHFRASAKQLSLRFNIDIVTIRERLDLATKAGLLKKSPDGVYEKAAEQTTTTHDVASADLRALHTSLLAEAARRLPTQETLSKDSGAVVMAIDSRKIPEAKRMIQVFRRDLMEMLEDSAERDLVYCFSSQLFSLELDCEAFVSLKHSQT